MGRSSWGGENQRVPSWAPPHMEVAVLSTGAHAEGIQVGLAQEDSSCLLQLEHSRGAVWRVIPCTPIKLFCFLLLLRGFAAMCRAAIERANHEPSEAKQYVKKSSNPAMQNLPSSNLAALQAATC